MIDLAVEDLFKKLFSLRYDYTLPVIKLSYIQTHTHTNIDIKIFISCICTYTYIHAYVCMYIYNCKYEVINFTIFLIVRYIFLNVCQ